LQQALDGGIVGEGGVGAGVGGVGVGEGEGGGIIPVHDHLGQQGSFTQAMLVSFSHSFIHAKLVFSSHSFIHAKLVSSSHSFIHAKLVFSHSFIHAKLVFSSHSFIHAKLVFSSHFSSPLHQILQSLGPQLLMGTGTSVVVVCIGLVAVVVDDVVGVGVVGFKQSNSALDSFPFPLVMVMLRINTHGGSLFSIS